MRSHHDMGGAPAGPVERGEHDYALWEKRVDALLVLLSKRQHMTVDELRRNIEALGADAYDKLTYYERWMHSIAQTLIQRGIVEIEELGRKIAMVEQRDRDDSVEQRDRDNTAEQRDRDNTAEQRDRDTHR